MAGLWAIRSSPWGDHHGQARRALEITCVQLLRSKDARVRRAAFTLLETSNPRLRRNSEMFIEITRFIWDANPSYDVYREFTKRHFQARYKVHELIGARLKMENQKKQRPAEDHLTDNPRHRADGFFTRLFRRASRSSQACEASWSQARRGACGESRNARGIRLPRE